MKREPSIESQGNPPSSPSHSSPASGSYVPSPAAKSPPKKRAKVKTETKPNVATSSRRARDTWTTDKCAELIELVITEGLKKGDVDGIAATLGVTRKQVTDQLCPNRSNLRATTIRAVRAAKR
ncbi:uncharacterized protein EHS24_004128 [Apiotrichum porosum]|uniref:Myb-like domain-containing protein n=1 Tax=Apiotrichum porosum TaxID=105984 RepID=A0A427Y4D2_9TREE|nr:uncharacterized protein EHS24_004128 [Apiotrichum porosum]RSH85942.1 hypothetical protein EHS24_004128 [Apiotrichum porosum]